jgi:hypothetical protein
MWFAGLARDAKLFPQRLGAKGSGAKTGMKELFAEPKIKKDGTLSKVCLISAFWHVFMTMHVSWTRRRLCSDGCCPRSLLAGNVLATCISF